jgi:L-fucose isomerase-like protein
MDELKVFFLMGPVDCNDAYIPTYSEHFLKNLSDALGVRVSNGTLEEVAAQELPVFFIASGGAEPGFLKNHEAVKPPYILLTTPAYNSLAAAMEILGYLDEQGKPGEILHGSIESIAKRLGVLLRAAQAKRKIAGMRLGAIGKPSGLISSEADKEKLKAASGMEIVELTLDELVEEYHKGGYPENEWTKELKSAGYASDEVEKALNVYGATCRMIERHNLQAVTIRCFELLSLIETTGCLALAILNAQGIPAACEGDTKSLASMVILNAITGQSSFMANPSCMDDQTMEIVFAHCTLPIDMPDRYRLTTHFESGIGVAVAGDVSLGKVTVFKCNDTLTRHYAGRAELLECPNREDLCRTQMRLKMLDGVDYFAHGPISNHHMIVKGDWVDEINEFFL